MIFKQKVKKAEFSAAVTPVFIVTWSVRNHSNMFIWCSRNISSTKSGAGDFFQWLVWKGIYLKYNFLWQRKTLFLSLFIVVMNRCVVIYKKKRLYIVFYLNEMLWLVLNVCSDVASPLLTFPLSSLPLQREHSRIPGQPGQSSGPHCA